MAAAKLWPRLIVVTLAATVPARAQAPPSLAVTRSPEAMDCPDEVTLAQAVTWMGGRITPVDSTARPATLLHVEISRSHAGYRAVIRVQGAQTGERVLTDTGTRCDNIAEAVTLTLAIISDTRQLSIPAASTASPPSQPTTHSSLSGDLGLGLGIQAGMLADVGPFVLAMGRAHFGDVFTAELGALVTPTQTIDHDESDGELDLRVVTGFAGLCVRLSSEARSSRIAFCAEPYVGWMCGTGRGFDRDRGARDHLWLAGGLAFDADGDMAGSLRWYLRAAGLAVMSQRFVVSVDGERDAIFESSPVALLTSAGVRVQFE